MAITGESNGEPMRVGVAITDVVCGMVATQSILAALFERATTGKGQFLDLSLIDCALSLLINVGSGYLNTGRWSNFSRERRYCALCPLFFAERFTLRGDGRKWTSHSQHQA